MDPAELRLKNLIRPEQFPYKSKTGWVYDSGDYATRDAQGDGDRRLRRAAPRAGREARARRADGHRHLVLHRDRRRRPAQGHGHPRPRHGRRRRAARPPDRQGGARHQRADAGPGPRDDVRPDRRRGARHPAGGHRGRPRRHRPHAVRPRHLRQPLDAGVGRRDRGRRAQGPREGAADRRRRCSRCSPDDLEWEKGRWFVKGDPEQGKTIQEIAMGAHGAVELPEGVEGRLDADHGLQPAEPDVPVRRLHLRRGHRPGHRRRSRSGASSRSTTAACGSTR